MTRTAIRELDALFSETGRHRRIIGRIVLSIIFRLRPMAVQTPTHVDYLRGLINGHLAYIAVTSLAIQSRGNMRAMHKVNEIRNPHHWYPLQRRVILNGLNEWN